MEVKRGLKALKKWDLVLLSDKDNVAHRDPRVVEDIRALYFGNNVARGLNFWLYAWAIREDS